MKTSRIVAALVLMATAAAGRENNDIVFLKNGDRITCEIKRLEDGLLYLKASYTTAEFAVDWNLIDHIQSKQLFVLRMSNGLILSGELAEEPSLPGQEAPGTLPIVGEEGRQEVKKADVVNIRQFGEGFVE